MLSRRRAVAVLAITFACVGVPRVSAQEKQMFFSFHVGSAHPLQTLDSLADANIHVHIDWSYEFGRQMDDVRRFNAKLIVGFNQFTAEPFVPVAHPHWTNISANLQVVWTLGGTGLRGYLQAGPGYYLPKSGSADLGFNVGLGLQVPLSAPFALEFGLDIHQIQTDDPVRFYTTQIGVLFR